MTGEPRVTIVIPAFNARKWIVEAIESARAQTYKSCEIIVVDDGSTDGTDDLLAERYGAGIQRVRQENRGLAAARNAGLARATGAYVQFLDADDLLLPAKIAAQVAALEGRPEFDVAYSDFAFFADDPARPSPSGFENRFASGEVLRSLLEDNFIVVHAALSRTEAVRRIGGFDERFRACEDYDLWLRLAAAGSRFLHTPGVPALYRRTPGSMSARRARQIAATIQAVEKVPKHASLDAQTRLVHRRRLETLRSHRRRAIVLQALSILKRPVESLAALLEVPRIAVRRLWHGLVPAIRMRLRPVDAKRTGELDYWTRVAAERGTLAATHYEWFYTRHFELDYSAWLDRRALDIGCGPRGSLEWATMAAQRVGLDPLALEYRSLGTAAHSMWYVAAASHAMPFPDAHFDLVASFNSLDHVDDLAGTVAEVVRVLKPNGRFLLLAEVNQPATVVEPITLTWETPSLFEPLLRPVRLRHFEMTERGMYDSVRAGTPYDHENPTRRSGILSALFVRD